MSTLKADTIVAADGSSPVTLTKQSAAKAWAKFDSSATLADSFNIASTVDVGTGQWRLSTTNALSSSDYTVVAGNGYQIGNFSTGHNAANAESSSTYYHSAYYEPSSVFQDFSSGGFGMNNVHGDLA